MYISYQKLIKMLEIRKRTFLSIITASVAFSQVKLEVNTVPTKVDIFLDGVNIGSSPIRDERIKPGVHKFQIKKKGYAPLKYDLLVNPAYKVKLDFFLNPIYECKFRTEEKGLVFELNGEHRWNTDNIRLQLEAGNHLLRVFKIGEIIDEQTITIDQPQRYNYFLKKPLAMDN